MRKKLKKIFISFIILICTFINISLADLGDFETYSSGSDWGSSSSSWSSSSYDRRSSSYSYDNDSYSLKENIIGIIIYIIVLIIVFITQRHGGKTSHRNDYYSNSSYPVRETEENIINNIQSIDELFNPEEFKSWVRDLFIKLQYAWSDRNFESVRCFETKELFEQHSSQIQRYKQNRQINKLERVSVNSVKLLSFNQMANKDILSVIVDSKMIDYIIDENTNQIIRGNNYENKFSSYKLTFSRTTGIKSKPEGIELNVANCPNCGAPTEITSSGRCSYCRSIITTGEHDWVLANIEKFKI